MAELARRFTALIGVAAALGTLVPVLAVTQDVSGVVRVNGRPQKDVVVWLEGVPPAAGGSRKAVLDQRNLTFSPHVLAIRVGTVVAMPNNDRVFHNVFSFKDGKRFDLGLYPVGKSKLVTFDKPGVSRIFCNIHPNMAAYVVAVDSEHFAVSDGSGLLTLAGVPAGTYTYHAWRAGHDPSTGQVAIDPARRVEFDLP
ncbi:MAG: methylamine utilization protein [Vicinamibacterales bacterium]